MIVGIGTDLCDIERIGDSLKRFGERFVQRCFTETERRRSDARVGRAASYAKRFAAKEACAKALGHTPGELALAWLLHQPAVTAPITGPRTMEQWESAVRAVDIRLDDAALARLVEIFPGHKTSPEDYAW